MSNLPARVVDGELVRTSGDGLVRREPRVVIFGSNGSGATVFARLVDQVMRDGGYSSIGLTVAAEAKNVEKVFFSGRRADFAEVAAEEGRAITPSDVGILSLFGIAVGESVRVSEVPEGELLLGEESPPDVVFAFEHMRAYDGGGYTVSTPFDLLEQLCSEHCVPLVRITANRPDGDPYGEISSFTGSISGSDTPLSLLQPKH